MDVRARASAQVVTRRGALAIVIARRRPGNEDGARWQVDGECFHLRDDRVVRAGVERCELGGADFNEAMRTTGDQDFHRDARIGAYRGFRKHAFVAETVRAYPHFERAWKKVRERGGRSDSYSRRVAHLTHVDHDPLRFVRRARAGRPCGAGRAVDCGGPQEVGGLLVGDVGQHEWNQRTSR